MKIALSSMLSLNLSLHLNFDYQKILSHEVFPDIICQTIFFENIFYELNSRNLPLFPPLLTIHRMLNHHSQMVTYHSKVWSHTISRMVTNQQ